MYKMNKKIFILFCGALFVSVYVHANDIAEIRPDPDTEQAVSIQKEGMGNFYKVSDILYRAEQPTAEGFKSLQAMGVKTIVSLRAHHSDASMIEGLNFKYIQIPINTWKLKDEHVEKFLRVMVDESNYPVLVHCQHGSDRTGTMVAVYRMVFENWSKEDALNEMIRGGFGYHSIWKNLKNYIDNFDIEKWKQRLLLYKEEAQSAQKNILEIK